VKTLWFILLFRQSHYGQFGLTPRLEYFLCPCSMGSILPFYLFFVLTERTSPMDSHAGYHICFLSVFLYRFDEPVQLLPSVFVKMVVIHLQLNLMPTLRVILAGTEINQSIKLRCSCFLNLPFFWRIITDMLYANTLN